MGTATTYFSTPRNGWSWRNNKAPCDNLVRSTRHEAPGSCAPAPDMKPGATPESDGFLHFIPTGAHCVLPRWSRAPPFRNLALRQLGDPTQQHEYRPAPPRHCQRRRTRQERSRPTTNGNRTSAARDPQGHRRHVVVFLRLAGGNLVEGAAARFIPGPCSSRHTQASNPRSSCSSSRPSSSRWWRAASAEPKG